MQQNLEVEPSFSEGVIACCECGAPIAPNPLNMCIGCVRSRVDILEGISKQVQIQSCRACTRYLVPPNSWVFAQLESKELMSICLGRLKQTMQKVRVVDAAFIWTEPHSKRLKVKVTIQKEVFDRAILQQSFVAEFVVVNQMCEECHRHEAKDYWRACVQVRQRCDYKKTLFYFEQLLVKSGAHTKCSSIKPVLTGIDFFFPRQQEARKLVDFITSVLPSKFQHSQQLVTHDVRNNYYDYKHTYCVDIVPITKDALICLPKHLAQQFSGIGQFVVCLRVTEVVTLISPRTLQIFEVNSNTYWKEPFGMLIQPKMLIEFYVLEVEEIDDPSALLPQGHGNVSNKHRLADVWVVRSDQVGQSDAKSFCCRTHLGRLLNPGDLVMGYNVCQSNLNDRVFDLVKEEQVPEVVLIKKVYDRSRRSRKRQWKLKRILDGVETESMEQEFMEFMEDLEEDPKLREKINIYRKTTKGKDRKSRTISLSVKSTEGGDEDRIEGPTLDEMLEDLEIEDNYNDVEMEGEGILKGVD